MISADTDWGLLAHTPDNSGYGANILYSKSNGKLYEKNGFQLFKEKVSFNKKYILTLLANPTISKVLLNQKAISFEAYNISGENYFKLRDLAKAVSATDKKFEVSWDGTHNAINITTNKAYTPDGGELVISEHTTTKKATPSESKLYFNGKETQLTAYEIDGSNYYKLREIAKLININVTWDGTSNTIGINIDSYNGQ
ncbi:hypothetical protein FU659_32370 [Paenibacillus sp. N3.4]|nr:hypothetical protein FU659_32370 [Paenibacillus sp. N3.4]